MKYVALVAVFAALAVVPSALAGSSWVDPTGEAAGSADITNVTVSNSPAVKTIIFSVQVADMPTLTEANAAIAIYIDADDNPATGDQSGVDCLFGIDNGGWFFGPWNGTSFDSASVDPAQFHVTYINGLMTVTMSTGECNLSNHIAFAVASFRGSDPQNPIIDSAPDSGVYEYVLSTAAPAVQRYGIATSTPQPQSSSTFMVTAFGARFSDGTSTDFVGVACKATLGGRRLRGGGVGGCSFAIPTKSKGKKLVVAVTGKGSTGIVYHSSFRYTVR